MKLSLRTKILLSVGCIIVIVFGTSTLVNIRNLKQEYVRAIEWRSDALALGIVNDVRIMQKYKPYYVTHIDELLSKLSERCAKLYELYREEDITHFAVIDAAGKIAAHNNQDVIDTPVTHSQLAAYLKISEKTTVLTGVTYHTLIPVFGVKGSYLGTIDIGVPKKIVDEKVEQIILRAFGLFCLFLVVAFLSISLLMHFILTTPITRLAAMGQQLAEGRFVHSIRETTQKGDEIAVLKSVFNNISAYLRDTATIAASVATGVLASEVRMRSEHDVLGKAVREMLHYLRNVAIIATQVEEGDLTETVEVRSSNDAFGRVFHGMTEGLRALIIRIRTSAQEIAATGTTISSFAIHNNNLVQHVHTSAQKTIATMQDIDAGIEDIANRMDTLSSSAGASFVSVKHMTSSIAHIASNTTKLTQEIHQTVSSLNNAVNSLEHVVKSTDVSQQLSQESLQDALEGQQAVEQVVHSMETLQQTINTAVELMTRFDQRSQDIDTIIEVIRGIADQTSLLALNASIIAAQAGEHGKSFGIVAAEIKSLANGVMTSTKEIAAIVNNLHQDMNSVVETVHQGASNVEHSIDRTQQAQAALHKIAGSAERSSSVVTEIAEALHEVMTTNHEISHRMQQVDTMTDEITSATNEQKTSMDQIQQALEYLNDMTSDIRETTVRQAAGSQEVFDATQNVTTLIEQNLESSQQLNMITEKLALQANLLLQSVDRFKLNS